MGFVALVACDAEPGHVAPVEPWSAVEQVTIGEESGDARQEFGRVANAVKVADGRIAIADGLHSEVRLFTAQGSYDRTFGRRGAGPGEFTTLTRLALLAGDTLSAGGTYRQARYLPDGTFIDDRQFAWPGLARPPFSVEAAWPLADGSFAVMLIESSAGQPAVRPLHRSGLMYVIAGADAALRDSLGVFPGLEQLSYEDAGRVHTAVPLFAAFTRLVVGREYLVIADMGVDSILRYHIPSARRTWVRVPLTRQRIGAAAMRRAQESACDWTIDAAAQQRCEISVRQLPPQTEYPLLRDVAVDSAGRIWLAMYTELPSHDDAEWLVVDGDGTVAARTRLPRGLRITQIGTGYVLGISQDSLGVQRVREFRIEPRAP